MKSPKVLMVLKVYVWAFVVCVSGSVLWGADPAPVGGQTVQAGAVFTVAESKRLIGKAVAQMPIVKKALRDGMVIITRGTTNTYVAEEILGSKIEPGAFVTGRIHPTKGGRRLKPKTRMSEIVLVNGLIAPELSFDDALKRLERGDVVIKGANILDYKNKTAGVLIGHSSSGTVGKFMPYVVARKVHLVIPVGLEKQAAGNVADVSNKMREPVPSLGRVPSMFLMTGHIVTEIEALKILAAVDSFQAAAGGIGGAEGAVWLVFRGPKPNVERAMDITKQVQGEPPFVK